MLLLSNTIIAYNGLFRGIYRGYIGIMEKKMETTIYIYIYIYI